MATPWTVGQALVTDLLIGRSSGYTLVGRSPSVTDEDAALLEAKPLITDFLHAEEKPIPYFAFFRLPSGAYALSRRFIKGRRRGSFNRVAVHTLVVSEELLIALDFEPTLLNSHCRYASSSETESNLSELGEMLMSWADASAAQGAELLRLPDLAVVLPEDAVATRWIVFHLRLQHLLKSRRPEQLEGELAAAFTVLERGQRLLLPQGSSEEQLLLLLWSALPWLDRRELAWTSHLAPTAADLFAIANVPEPSFVLPKLGQRELWRVLEGQPARASTTAATLARWLVEQPDELPRHLEDARQHGVRLVGGKGRLSALAEWLAHGGDEVLAGFAVLPQLHAYLARVGAWATSSSEEEQPFVWQHPAYHLLVVCATLRNILGKEPLENLRRAVLTDLEKTNTGAVLLHPGVLSVMAGRTFEHVGVAEVVAAVWLMLDPDASPPPLFPDVLQLWRVFGAVEPPPVGAGRELYVEVASNLVRELTRESVRLDQQPTSQVVSWAESVERVAGVLVKAERRAEASRLCRHWWGRLFRQWPETWPLERLEMLRLMTSEDREELLRGFCERLPRLPDEPQHDQLVLSLAKLVPDAAVSRVEWQDAILLRSVRLGRVGIVVAVERARQLLEQTAAKSLEDQLVRRVRIFLPQGAGQAHKLFELVLASELGLEVKLLLEDRVVKSELQATKGAWVAEMPSFEEVERLGSLDLQLKVARQLGHDWPRDSQRAVVFLLSAARMGRFDVLGSFFRGESEKRKLDLLGNLDGENPAEKELFERLVRAAEDSRHRVDLRQVGDRLRQPEGEQA